MAGALHREAPTEGPEGSDAASSAGGGAEDALRWTVDVVWRNRSWKDVAVEFSAGSTQLELRRRGGGRRALPGGKADGVGARD